MLFLIRLGRAVKLPMPNGNRRAMMTTTAEAIAA
jgi:hypothetical protein